MWLIRFDIYLFCQLMKQTSKHKKKRMWNLPNFEFQNGMALVKFINKIPNIDKIKYKLSEQECRVVSQNRNLMVVGRSGTGKTTCALMRLFAIQIFMLDQVARYLHNPLSGIPYSFQADDLDRYSGVKNVFLTASTHLISSINQQFHTLKYHLQTQIQKINKKKAKKEKRQETVPPSQFKQRQYGRERVQHDEAQEEQRRRKYVSFKTLEQTDFPGFFSIQQFILMLDGCFLNSFFKRDIKTKQLIVNQKGLRKRKDQYTLYQVNLDSKSKLGLQCTYQIFKQQFWPTVCWKDILKRHDYLRGYQNIGDKTAKKSKKATKPNYKEITAIGVWTEIISTIQGSCEAHLCQNGHLSLEKYIEQSKNVFYGQLQKLTVFDIFLHFKQWKLNSSTLSAYYDSLDIANHILTQLQQFNSSETMQLLEQVFGDLESKPEFNYLFLDEVQDLPPVVTYLISLIFKNGLYYSGDSAQVIKKGIAFSFSDIQRMFQTEDFPLEPLSEQKLVKHNLTVNFRSHNQILGLANNIVKLLQNMFPASIDFLKQESSNDYGPRPAIEYGSGGVHSIKYIMEEKISLLKQEKLGLNQVVIVRNEKIKNELKQQVSTLKLDYRIQILTIEQCKGLEFNDVILYKIFDPQISDKWTVLKYSDLYPKRGIKQFNLWQIKISQYDILISQLKMLYTVVTRARCSLIFCDCWLPEQLFHIWDQHHLISRSFDKEMSMEYKLEHFADEKPSWEKKGYDYYNQKQYEMALQYYKQAGKGFEDMIDKIEAQISSQKGEALLNRFERQYAINPAWYEMELDQLPDNNHWLQFHQKCQKQVFPALRVAGQHFENIKSYQKAANCFYEAEYYKKAIQMYFSFKKTIFYKQIALCYQKLKKYEMAANNYLKASQVTRAILALQRIPFYQKCLQIIRKQQGYKYRQFFYRKHYNLISNRFYLEIDKKIGIKSQLLDIYSTKGKVEYFKEVIQLSKYSLMFFQAKKELLQIDLPQVVFKQSPGQLKKQQAAIRKIRAIKLFQFEQILRYFGYIKSQKRQPQSNQKFYQIDYRVRSIMTSLNQLNQRIRQFKYSSSDQSQRLVAIIAQLRMILERRQFTLCLEKGKQKIQELYFNNICSSAQDQVYQLRPINYYHQKQYILGHFQLMTSFDNDPFKTQILRHLKPFTFYSPQERNKHKVIDRGMHHRFLSHVLLQRQIFSQKIKKQDSLKLQELELLAPRAYLEQVTALQIPQLAVDAIIWCLSYFSLNYMNKTFQGSRVYYRPSSNVWDFLNVINPDYFNFDIQRTKYSKCNAMNQIIEAAIFLGFCDEICQKFTLENSVRLKHTFVKQGYLEDLIQTSPQLSLQKLSQQTKEWRYKEWTMKKNIQSTLSIMKTMVQYRALNKHHQNAWMGINNYQPINLTNQQEKEIEQTVKISIKGLKQEYEEYISSLQTLKNQIISYLTLYTQNRNLIENDTLRVQRKKYFDKKFHQQRQKITKEQNNSSEQEQIRQYKFQKLAELAIIDEKTTLRQLQSSLNRTIHQIEYFCSQQQKKWEKSPLLLEVDYFDNIIADKKRVYKGKIKILEGFIAKHKQQQEDNLTEKVMDYFSNGPLKLNDDQLKKLIRKHITLQLNNFLDGKVKLTNKGIQLIIRDLKKPEIPPCQTQQTAKKQKMLKLMIKGLQERLKQIKEYSITPTKYIQLERKITQMEDDFSQPFENVKNRLKQPYLVLWKDQMWSPDAKNYKNRTLKLQKRYDELLNLMEQQREYKSHIYSLINLLYKDIEHMIDLNDQAICCLQQLQKKKTNLQKAKESAFAKAKQDEINAKRKRVYLNMRYEQTKKLSPEMGNLSSQIKGIFFNQNTRLSIKKFNQTMDNTRGISRQQTADAMLIFFSQYHYNTFREAIEDCSLFGQERRYFFTHIETISAHIKDMYVTVQGFNYLQCLLELLQCRLIIDEPFMSIYRYFVVINQNSVLMTYLRARKDNFSYYIDQKRQTLLVTLRDVMPALESITKMYLNNSSWKQFIAKLMLDFNNIMIQKPMLQLVGKIQTNRQQIFRFMGDNSFITHHSSLFCYHQLKYYTDLLQLLSVGKLDPSLENHVRKDMQQLQKQFAQWKLYAEKYEFPVDIHKCK